MHGDLIDMVRNLQFFMKPDVLNKRIAGAALEELDHMKKGNMSSQEVEYWVATEVTITQMVKIDLVTKFLSLKNNV